MKDYRFRGLTAKNELVYGYLVPDAPNSTAYYNEYSQRICWFPDTGGHANTPVKNGTVGQFINIVDKNGKDIYEGDIVTSTWYTYDEPVTDLVGIVEYCQGWGAFWIANYESKTFSEINGQGYYQWDIEVIGNIYEAKEDE